MASPFQNYRTTKSKTENCDTCAYGYVPTYSKSNRLRCSADFSQHYAVGRQSVCDFFTKPKGDDKDVI